MKDTVSFQQQELDLIESDILTTAACRGWELSEYLSCSASVAQVKLRLQLLIGCTDSRIARLMIVRHTDSTNRILKHLHSSASVDRHTRMLVQKLTDSHCAAIRRMQEFL